MESLPHLMDTILYRLWRYNRHQHGDIVPNSGRRKWGIYIYVYIYNYKDIYIYIMCIQIYTENYVESDVLPLGFLQCAPNTKPHITCNLRDCPWGHPAGAPSGTSKT